MGKIFFNQMRKGQGKSCAKLRFFLQFFAEFCKTLYFFCKFLQFFAVFYTPLRV